MAGKHDKHDKQDRHDKKSEKAERAERAEHAHDGRRSVAANGRRQARANNAAGADASASSWGGPVAIVGARLIDGSGADPVDDAALVFEGERILAVGPRR